MSVSCGSREIISCLISSKQIQCCSQLWRARSDRRRMCSSKISLARKWTAKEGNLRMRLQHASPISVSLRRRKIVCAKSSDSDSLTEDAENGNPGKPGSAVDSVDFPEASFRRDAVSSASSEAVFDACIAEFLPPSEQKRIASDLPTLLRRFWKVAAPYWSSEDKVKARFWLVGVFALTLATTGISVGFNFLGRDFYNALASKDQEQFYNQLVKYFAAFLGGIPVFVLRDYFRDTLALRWRGWMTTQYLDKYFENRTFYNIQSQSMIDNPDQRIVDDLNSFSGSALSFALALFNATINLISFSGILYGIYPPLFFVLLVYSIGGTAISVLLGKNLVGLNFMQEKKEADFRYGLVRVRENAESIAFYGGETSEIQLLLQRFKQSFDNYTQLLIASRNLDFFTSFYRYLIQLLPAAVVAPLYFAGKIEFGVINQSFSAFNNVLSDFSIIVYQFQSLSAFSAVVDRLVGTPCTRLLSDTIRAPSIRPSFTRAPRSVLHSCVRVRVIRSEVKKQRSEFVYSRAKPEVRWPHKSEELLQQQIARQSESAGRPRLLDWEELSRLDAGLVVEEEGEQYVAADAETSLAQREEMVRQREAFRQRQKGQARRLQSMSKLALRKATDLKNRAKRLSTAICSLELARPVTDVLETWPEQLNNDELSVVVRNVGDQNWQRALELYKWLNLQKWYTPNPRLLATMLHILGRANQLEAARELFWKAEPELSSCIQVFNAILGVYAKQGQWEAVEQILELIEQRGCEPDIITFNTIANARCKYDLQPGMASALLKEIERAGLRPDIITYNTLLGGCIANKNVTEAAEIVKEMEQRGFDLNACTSYVLGKKYMGLGEGGKSVLSTLDETFQQQALSNDVQDDGTVQQTTTPVVESNMSTYVLSNINRIESSSLQAGDSHQMVTPYTRSPEAVCRPADESRFSIICLFMQWKAVHAISRGDQSLRCGLGLGSKRLGIRKLRSCRIHAAGWISGDLYHTITREPCKQLHLCKAAQVPLPDTEEANHILSDVGQIKSELVQVAMQETSVETANASSYTKLINECMMKKDYSTGLERLTEMIEAGIEPGYMTWICVLQACGQCDYRIDLLRLLAALRDAGCRLPLRLIMEREAAMAEVEDWFRYLQATAADAGQGMVNVLVDILWAFKLRALAGQIYNLAVRLDMYPRNFARVEEQKWEADFRSLSPGTALVALNHWFIEMQKATLDGFPETPKEALMVTGTQGYQNGVSLNKTLRAHLWEMGSPFYMRPPREGALITKGHALRLWLKDSPRCFNLDLEDDVRLPKANSMSFFKGAWMSSDAVPVMKQIHTSLGEVWPRRYSKLAHMTETRRIEALAARIENEKRRRLEKREKPVKPTKKKRPLRR